MIICFSVNAQKAEKRSKHTSNSALANLSIDGLRFRSIGPALTSGRISDIAVNPYKPHEYYIATASGGVWKTVNSGTTYEPIFDEQGSYSIGCVTIDPQRPNTIWVGTGENNGQRSVAYGDGIYKSIDAGKTWKNMGLGNSEHIGKIIVHPANSDIIYVAAIGPLWNSGGDRGLYKSTDGGNSWKLSLATDKHTGVNDIIMDIKDPNILYASTYQRARHVFTYVGGGPGSNLYKSTDGGDSWHLSNNGLPKVDLGRIGLSTSQADANLLYAIVEAADKQGGFYKSENQGATWVKQSKFTTIGLYYQEIVADPIDRNTVYAMDTWLKVSHDGGKTFKNTGEATKHVDNHSMWINPKNNQHWLLGCDGGIYETWDAAKTWDYKANLPVTQFYKVSVDNAEPFYNVFGGTQDNFSLAGPSRSITSNGIANSDWYVTNGGDGFETAIDHFNPDIVYAQAQYGHLVRHDRSNGEEVGIQPIPRKNEDLYRFNWDAPLIASPHKAGRVYFASNKVFKSEDYGNSWEVISEDLTKQINRNELKIMDRIWSIDAVAKNRSTSPYGTIVSMSESTLNPNLIIIGTDDGNIQLTNNGGTSWNKLKEISGAPKNSYLNDVKLSIHDENIIYAVFNHHKFGDFKPYIFKSTNKGVSWKDISSNLPNRGSVYVIQEDHIDPDLIFCGTEFGVYFSPTGGSEWKQIKSGVPTIAIRDIAIQRRENDLVLGTFGRGFYILDDYSCLRHVRTQEATEQAIIYPIKDALLFEHSKPLGLSGKAFQGDNFYLGENLKSSANIYFYFDKEIKSHKKLRQNKDTDLAKKNQDTPYPSYNELKAEATEVKAKLLFTIKDDKNKIVRKLIRQPKKGIQNLKWDLRYASKKPINLKKPSFYNPFRDKNEGALVQPGKYSVEMSLINSDGIQSLTEPINFNIYPLSPGSLTNTDRSAKTRFQREVSDLHRSFEGARHLISEINNKLKHIDKATILSEIPLDEILSDYQSIKTNIYQLRNKLFGDPIKRRLDIGETVSPHKRISQVLFEQTYSTAAPTQTHIDSYTIAKEEFKPILEALRQIATVDIPNLEKKLEDADAPYTPGRAIQMMMTN